MIRAAETVVRWFARALAFVAGVGLILMMLQTVIDVVMKNVFGAPIEGNLEIVSVYHMVALVFLPLAIVELKHEHISVDLVVRLFPLPLRRTTETLSYLISALFFGILAWQTWLDAIEAWRIGEILMTSILITIWPAKFSLPVGFAAVMLASLLHAWAAATDPDFDPTPGDAHGPELNGQRHHRGRRDPRRPRADRTSRPDRRRTRRRVVLRHRRDLEHARGLGNRDRGAVQLRRRLESYRGTDVLANGLRRLRGGADGGALHGNAGAALAPAGRLGGRECRGLCAARRRVRVERGNVVGDGADRDARDAALSLRPPASPAA